MNLKTLLAKMSLIGLVIAFLSGCVTTRPVNFEYRAERCIITTEFDKCRCHEYLITPNFSGRVSESIDRELEYCDRFIGFSADDWVQLVNQITNVIRKSTDRKTLRFESGADILFQLWELENGL